MIKHLGDFDRAILSAETEYQVTMTLPLNLPSTSTGAPRGFNRTHDPNHIHLVEVDRLHPIMDPPRSPHYSLSDISPLSFPATPQLLNPSTPHCHAPNLLCCRWQWLLEKYAGSVTMLNSYAHFCDAVL